MPVPPITPIAPLIWSENQTRYPSATPDPSQTPKPHIAPTLEAQIFSKTMYGNTPEIIQENIRTLRHLGLSETEAIRRAVLYASEHPTSAPKSGDIALPNESGQIDPRIAAQYTQKK